MPTHLRGGFALDLQCPCFHVGSCVQNRPGVFCWSPFLFGVKRNQKETNQFGVPIYHNIYIFGGTPKYQQKKCLFCRTLNTFGDFDWDLDWPATDVPKCLEEIPEMAFISFALPPVLEPSPPTSTKILFTVDGQNPLRTSWDWWFSNQFFCFYRVLSLRFALFSSTGCVPLPLLRDFQGGLLKFHGREGIRLA